MASLSNKKTTCLFSLSWAIESLLIFLFFLIPSEPQSRSIWLYSTSRLAVILFAALLSGISLILYGKIRQLSENTPFFMRASQKGWKESFVFGGLFLLLSSNALHAVVRLLAKDRSFTALAGYTYYTSIFALYFSLFGIALALYTFYMNRETFIKFAKNEKNLFRTAYYLWLFFIALFLLSEALYKNANASDAWYTSGPHAPLLEWQIVLAWLVAAFIMLYEKNVAKKSFSDGWIAIFMWVLTLTLWLSQPINPGYGAQAPVAPNYEIYPFSDAQLYAQNSQSIIIGKGMAGEEFPARPIYVIFLAVAHALVGQDYSHIIAFQTIFLATFPAILYLLGKELSGRPLGVAVALLAIFRDITSNAVAHFTVSLTYSKVFLSELPVALLLSLFSLLAVYWIKKYPRQYPIPFIGGGVIGIAILIRTQSIVAIIPAICIAWIVQKGSFKQVFIQTMMIMLGITMVLSPWLIRNWQHTGGIVLDNPLSQMNVLAVRYADYPEMEIPRVPGENDSEYSNRMLKVALKSIAEDPERIFTTVGNQVAQNIFGGLLVFPLRDSLPNIRSLFIPTSNFWQSWGVTSQKGVLYFFYAFLFMLGLAAAWKKERWLGLLPLGINFLYNFWTALFFASGIRFVFPVDWIFYLYQMLGLLTLTRYIFLGLGTQFIEAEQTQYPREALPRWGYGAVIGLLFLSGLSLPLSEIIVPDQYPDKTQNQMWDDFHAKTSTTVDESLILIEGRAIYPRYFEANEGIALTAKPGYEPSPESRLVFELVGQKTGRVIFPLENMPEYFPNTVNLILLTRNGDLNETEYILISDENATILYERNHE